MDGVSLKLSSKKSRYPLTLVSNIKKTTSAIQNTISSFVEIIFLKQSSVKDAAATRSQKNDTIMIVVLGVN